MDADRVQVHRTLDLAGIRAVGFDLDHTLALYDDDAANRIACEETAPLLAAAGYPSRALEVAYDPFSVSRGLLIDRRGGAVVKIDGARRVARGLVAGRRLDTTGIAALYGGAPVDPADFHAVHSFFDLAGAFLFTRLAASRFTPGLCDDVLIALDRAHTTGNFKRRVVDDLAHLVHGPPGLEAALGRWRDAGKRLFVVTNSGAAYTTTLLDHLFPGGAWSSLFALVVTDADKPAFFARGGTARRELLVAGAGADWVERALGVAPREVLFVGDNAAADVIPAARHGWRTAHVVAERAATAVESSTWGSPLVERGQPTWFASLSPVHADLSAASAASLLALPPGGDAAFDDGGIEP